MTRIALTAGVLAAWLLGVWGMWRGWQARVRRTPLADLPAVPELPGADLTDPLVGLYLGTTRSGAWLDRVAASRLGERSSGWLRVLPAGLLLSRPSYDDVFVPVAALRSVRLDTGHAGRVVGPDGVLVVEWLHGGQLFETGFRGDDQSRHTAVAATIVALAATREATSSNSPKETT